VRVSGNTRSAEHGPCWAVDDDRFRVGRAQIDNSATLTSKQDARSDSHAASRMSNGDL
jgi:hypothetical protein